MRDSAGEALFGLLDLRREPTRFVFVFVCYLDDSDNHAGATMGMAGYLARAAQWVEFERQMDSFLQSKGIQVLRGKDFHNGHHDFKNWSGKRKAEFVEDLYQIAARYIIQGSNTVVDKKYYARTRVQYQALRNVSPLGAAFGTLVHSLIEKDFAPTIPENEFEVSFVVELGNKNNGNIERYYSWLKSRWPKHGDHKLGALSFIGKGECRAIQLADFLAFHGRREGDRWAKSRFRQTELVGHAMKIMNYHIFHRHNRIYDNGKGLMHFGERTVIDNMSGIVLNNRGLK